MTTIILITAITSLIICTVAVVINNKKIKALRREIEILKSDLKNHSTVPHFKDFSFLQKIHLAALEGRYKSIHEIEHLDFCPHHLKKLKDAIDKNYPNPSP